MTRLLKTPIIGRSATTVVSSRIDMLAGLSTMCCLKIPPRFCASAVPAAVIKTNAPRAAIMRRDAGAMSSSVVFYVAVFSVCPVPCDAGAPVSMRRAWSVSRNPGRRETVLLAVSGVPDWSLPDDGHGSMLLGDTGLGRSEKSGIM
jgi:hypothetical protein